MESSAERHEQTMPPDFVTASAGNEEVYRGEILAKAVDTSVIINQGERFDG